MSVEVRGEQDSPSCPGQPCALSMPLDEYCHYDALFDGLMPVFKDPLPPLENYVVKSKEVTQESPDVFVVKITHDGDKLSKYAAKFGFAHLNVTDSDFVRWWGRITFDRKGRTIVSEELEPDGVTVKRTVNSLFLESPLRVEVWSTNKEGVREGSNALAGEVQHCFLTPVVQSLAARKVGVHHTCPSPTSGGSLVALSEPMCEYFEYDELFDMVVEVLKDAVQKDGAVGEVSDISDTEFEIVVRGEGGTEDAPCTMVQHIMHDVSKGEIICVASLGPELLYTSFIKMPQDPLCIEYWIESSGTRLAGPPEGATLQSLIDACMRAKGDFFFA